MDKNKIIEIATNELYSAVISDTLDSIGLHNQTLDIGINSLMENNKIVGYARTGIYMPIYHDKEGDNVYEEEIRLVDSLIEHDVVLLSCANNTKISPWGELLSTRAQFLKAAGCITDGCIRDSQRICEIGFPVFSAGRFPSDTKYRGKMMWSDVPVVMNGVRINPGDLIVADRDGIVATPAECIQQVISASVVKVSAESDIRSELMHGKTLQEVFGNYGIL